MKALIEDRARSMGGSPYVLAVRSEREVSYLELAVLTDQWRHELATSLVGEDRIGLLISDPLDFATTFLGLLAGGVWVAPLDPAFADMTADQLEERLRPLGLSTIISDRPAPLGSGFSWRSVVTGLGAFEAVQDTSLIERSSGGVILSSSGTSGVPKVVALTTSQLLQTAWLVAEHNELEPSDRGFNPLPLWHINAEVVAVLATLVAGASLAIDERFHRTDFWSTVERLEVTWINAVPAIIARLTNLQVGEKVPTGVRFIRSASAPLAPALLDQFERTVGIAIIETYGMTEAASQICANPLSGPRKTGSVGKPVGVELRVRPGEIESTELTGPQIGEVEIRGASVVRGYESPGLEGRFDAEGWLSTGDQGYLDDDGYLFLVGRIDDMINRGGEKIFPREIEDVVLGRDHVANAAVIGVADDVFGQVPVLYVQVEGAGEGSSVDLVELVYGDIRAALGAGFSRAMRPVELVIVEKMPTHATGKIQKKALTGEDVVVLGRTAFQW